MLEYIIEGGKKLEGNIDISGSKNASLPIMAGAILGRFKKVMFTYPGEI